MRKAKKPFHDLLGVVVPNQLFAIPLIENNDRIKIVIEYTTKMHEKIEHNLDFKNGITEKYVEKIMAFDSVRGGVSETLFESDSILFRYVH